MTLRAKGLEERIRKDAENGRWVPAPTDPLHDCDFVKAGFRSWALESPDHKWRLVLSKLDFGAREPSALLEVYADKHDNAFGDFDWFAFSHSIGTNGGTNFNQATKRLMATLGGAEIDWQRRITYLIKRAKEANVSGGNGTFAAVFKPDIGKPPDYIFEGRIREGRTMSLFGPGSAGKTTIADGLIASLCSGTEIIPGWVPARHRRVLILDWDEGYEEESIRLNAMCAAYRIDLGGNYNYKRMTRPLHDVADEVGTFVAAGDIEVVIVSPMGRASRNFGENITAPVDEVHEILRSLGTTNILIDHVTGDNIRGGAQREFGSVRKRDNVRGSYAIDVQSEEPGVRVLVMRNTKADALSPRQSDQAVRVEFEPHWPKDDGSYDTITFHSDVIQQQGYGSPGEPYRAVTLREQIRDLLVDEHMSAVDIALALSAKPESIERVLYRYRGKWFGNLPSTNRWELLPEARKTLTDS